MKKLKSESGASISFALLLFLVCATAGAVVLAAGTAAAGRLSQMVNMDKRYYSASSAASLLAKEIEGKEVTIVRSLEEVVVTTTEYDEYGNAGTPTKVYTLTYETKVNQGESIKRKVSDTNKRPSSPGDDINITSSFLSRQASYFMFKEGKCNTDDALNNTFGLTAKQNREFSLTGTGELKNLSIENRKVTLNEDCSMDFEIGSTVNNQTYTVVLHMTPDINESSSSSMNTETSVTPGDGGSYTETRTETTFTENISTISWNAESMKKKTAPISTPSETP